MAVAAKLLPLQDKVREQYDKDIAHTVLARHSLWCEPGEIED
jgi:hypothetical protein